jgi:multidrug resistance protein
MRSAMLPHQDPSPDGIATERSPLLARDDATNTTEAANGDTAIDGSNKSGNGTFTTPKSAVDADTDADGEPLERQPEDGIEGRNEGIPEVKARMKYIFPAIAIGVFLSAADQTIIVSSSGKIGSELDSLSLVSWIATAYFLTLTSFQPLYGKLSDIFGRKPCLLFGYCVFGIGCLLCGLAQNMGQLIAARAFSGIGGGGMTTVVSILLSDMVPLRERGKWQGYVNIIYATGASTGAPLGGILADSIGWRWAFLIQAPLCLAAFAAVSLVLKLPKTESSHWKTQIRRIDFLGAAILICAIFTLLFGLDRGSNVSWSSKTAIISLSVSLPLFIIFVLVEMKIAAEPFAPGHIIFHRSLFACYLCNFFSFSGWLAALFYLPLYFQAVDNVSATGAGLRLIPAILCGVSGSLAGGIYMQKTGRYFWLTVTAYAGLTLGMTAIFLCSGVVFHSSIGIIIGMCFCGFGNGIGVTSTLIGLIANASKDDQAIATACSYLFRSLGSVFGVAMSATVANSALRKNLTEKLPTLGLPEAEALEIAERVRQSLAYLKDLKPAVRAVVADCYAGSTSHAFGLQIGLVAGAALSAWLIKEKALSR